MKRQNRRVRTSGRVMGRREKDRDRERKKEGKEGRRIEGRENNTYTHTNSEWEKRYRQRQWRKERSLNKWGEVEK